MWWVYTLFQLRHRREVKHFEKEHTWKPRSRASKPICHAHLHCIATMCTRCHSDDLNIVEETNSLFGYFLKNRDRILTLWPGLTELFHRSCVERFIKMNWKLWVDVETQTFNNRLTTVLLVKGRQCKQIYISHTMRHMFQIYLSPVIVLKCICHVCGKTLVTTQPVDLSKFCEQL